MTTKEGVFDEHIAPLMATIQGHCQSAGINFTATFHLDRGEFGNLRCSTNFNTNDPDDTQGIVSVEQHRDLEVALGKQPWS